MRLGYPPDVFLGVAGVCFALLALGYGLANLESGEIEGGITVGVYLFAPAAIGSAALLVAIPLLPAKLPTQLFLIFLFFLAVGVALATPGLVFGSGVLAESLEIIGVVGPLFGIVATVMLIGLRARPVGVLVVAAAFTEAFIVILLLLPLCPPEAFVIRPLLFRSPIEVFCVYWPFAALPVLAFFAMEFLYPLPRLPRIKGTRWHTGAP